MLPQSWTLTYFRISMTPVFSSISIAEDLGVIGEPENIATRPFLSVWKSTFGSR